MGSTPNKSQTTRRPGRGGAPSKVGPAPTLFLATNNTLFVCGDNSYGQLGVGRFVYTVALQPVGTPAAARGGRLGGVLQRESLMGGGGNSMLAEHDSGGVCFVSAACAQHCDIG